MLARTLEASESGVCCFDLGLRVERTLEAFTILTALYGLVSTIGLVEHANIEDFDTGAFRNLTANIFYECKRPRRFPDPSLDPYALATVTGRAILGRNLSILEDNFDHGCTDGLL